MADDGGIIDEKGRLFGLVNIIDLFIVVLAVLVLAGTVVVLTGNSETNEEPATRYATLEFAQQPSLVAEQISVGDNAGGVTITDVYRTELPNGTTQVLVRAEVAGTESGGQFRVGEKPFRVGRSLGFNTQEYQLSATVAAVNQTGDSLPIEQRQVIIESRVSQAVADAIDVGDEYRVAGEPIATVEALEVNATEGTNSHVRLTLDVQTLVQGDTAEFNGRPVRIGASLAFRTSEYELDGEVLDVSG